MEPKCPQICKTWNRPPGQHFCFKQRQKNTKFQNIQLQRLVALLETAYMVCFCDQLSSSNRRKNKEKKKMFPHYPPSLWDGNWKEKNQKQNSRVKIKLSMKIGKRITVMTNIHTYITSDAQAIADHSITNSQLAPPGNERELWTPTPA